MDVLSRNSKDYSDLMINSTSSEMFSYWYLSFGLFHSCQVSALLLVDESCLFDMHFPWKSGNFVVS
jgi:hypothetical protein